MNEKIEGFFDVCKSKGLTGEQGVLIPHQNVKNLMLKDEVIAEVKKGNFHIYQIRTVEEGCLLYTSSLCCPIRMAVSVSCTVSMMRIVAVSYTHLCPDKVKYVKIYVRKLHKWIFS